MIAHVFLLAAVAALGECTKCYTCTTVDSKCADPFKTDGGLEAQECTPSIIRQFESQMTSGIGKSLSNFGSTLFGTDLTKTFKDQAEFVCFKLDYGDGERKESLRGCVPKAKTTDENHWCKIMEDQMNKDKTSRVSYCDYCDTDMCNTGTRGVTPSSIVALVLAAVGAFLLSH